MPLMNEPDEATGRAVVITHGFQNHAVRTTDWHYIRYEDGTEELYDLEKDARNFHNLAGLSRYAFTKRTLAKFLPKLNAVGHPTFNGQKAQNEKWERENTQR